MARALWNDRVIAESDTALEFDGRVYFPLDSLKKDYFQPSDTHTTCQWKGQASYYNVEVDGKTNNDAAWYYPEPMDAAVSIKNHVAFWRGVTVEN